MIASPVPRHLTDIKRLDEFIAALAQVVETTQDEAALLAKARPLLAGLVSHDDWLPEPCAQPGDKSYRQYLLYLDPRERFSIISFVWAPGQRTPIHDHTVWGLVGVMRGAERCVEYTRDASGRVVAAGHEHVMRAGQVEAVSPTVGDIHTVANALDDRPSISIHVYGADIGRVRRHWYDAETGEAREFVSGYSNA